MKRKIRACVPCRWPRYSLAQTPLSRYHDWWASVSLSDIVVMLHVYQKSLIWLLDLHYLPSKVSTRRFCSIQPKFNGSTIVFSSISLFSDDSSNWADAVLVTILGEVMTTSRVSFAETKNYLSCGKQCWTCGQFKSDFIFCSWHITMSLWLGFNKCTLI